LADACAAKKRYRWLQAAIVHADRADAFRNNAAAQNASQRGSNEPNKPTNVPELNRRNERQNMPKVWWELAALCNSR
jgi:hypothetical protein